MKCLYPTKFYSNNAHLTYNKAEFQCNYTYKCSPSTSCYLILYKNVYTYLHLVGSGLAIPKLRLPCVCHGTAAAGQKRKYRQWPRTQKLMGYVTAPKIPSSPLQPKLTGLGSRGWTKNTHFLHNCQAGQVAGGGQLEEWLEFQFKAYLLRQYTCNITQVLPWFQEYNAGTE